MPKPLVSVITPTWNRHEKLLNRCIPSVQAQVYRNVQHVIVSDGPDPELAAKMAELAQGSAFYHHVTFIQLPLHTGAWGSIPRQAGVEAAKGEYMAYVDDDDELRPDHCRVLAQALRENPALGFAYSIMQSHSQGDLATHIGTSPPQCGQIGTPMLMHTRQALEHGSWGPPSGVEDWELVERWLNAGVGYVHVPEVTVNVWPSAYWG